MRSCDGAPTTGSAGRCQWVRINGAFHGAALHSASRCEAGLCKSLNEKMLVKFLAKTWLRNLAHACDLILAWTTDNNAKRPHQALGY